MALKHNWTHYLICFENVGNGLKRKIFKRCKIVRTAKTGQKVIEVEGTFVNEDKNIKREPYQRYTDADKLIDMYESVG